MDNDAGVAAAIGSDSLTCDKVAQYGYCDKLNLQYYCPVSCPAERAAANADWEAYLASGGTLVKLRKHE